MSSIESMHRLLKKRREYKNDYCHVGDFVPPESLEIPFELDGKKYLFTQNSVFAFVLIADFNHVTIGKLTEFFNVGYICVHRWLERKEPGVAVSKTAGMKLFYWLKTKKPSFLKLLEDGSAKKILSAGTDGHILTKKQAFLSRIKGKS